MLIHRLRPCKYIPVTVAPASVGEVIAIHGKYNGTGDEHACQHQLKTQKNFSDRVSLTKPHRAFQNSDRLKAGNINSRIDARCDGRDEHDNG